MKRRTIIPYNPSLKQLARNLRNNSTLSEIILWNKLKGKQMMGFDFHRQKPLDNFIVDFFCNELMLAIEIDGSSHNEKMDYDEQRQDKLESLGIKFLRFQDKDVRFNLENVLFTIEGWIKEHTPSPALKRGVRRCRFKNSFILLVVKKCLMNQLQFFSI